MKINNTSEKEEKAEEKNIIIQIHSGDDYFANFVLYFAAMRLLYSYYSHVFDHTLFHTNKTK